MANVPEPVLPDFGGPNVAGVADAVLAQVQGGPPETVERPDWLPADVVGARQAVLLVLDGLGFEQLKERAALAPTIAAADTGPITSVAPSTTAAALTSLTTGLPPAVHGVFGYRVAVGGEVMNVLAWTVGAADARQRVRPRAFQPYPVFPRARRPVPVVSRAEYAATGFTAAHLADAPLHGWVTPSGLAVEVGRLLGQGEPFIYAYYDGVDRVSHARGLGPHYEAELRTADQLVGDICDLLPPGAVLVVTADHGQVEVGPAIEVLGGAVMDGVELLSGEGRFRWLHVRPGAIDDVADAAGEAFGHLAWVRTKDAVIEEGWLGGEPAPAVADRLGDVALVPFQPIAFMDPADTGELRLVGRHGSLTAAEMLVPLAVLAAPGS